MAMNLAQYINNLSTNPDESYQKMMHQIQAGDPFEIIGMFDGMLGFGGNKMRNRGNTKFRRNTLKIIQQANDIISEYGSGLTLRQLYYQFVARDLLRNNKREYDKLGRIIGDARLAGLIEWNAIIDRTRTINQYNHFQDPAEILEVAADTFRLDTRADQDFYIEVWVEKEALIGVIEPVCRELDVTYLACRGYMSLSAMWEAVGRFNEAEQAGQKTIVIHLGDHDPSGLDMTNDIRNRLEGFGVQTEVERIALNKEQVEQYNPPPNPAKLTDTRSSDYIALYGPESWELDALEPQVITDLIETTVDKYTDESKRQSLIELQQEYKVNLAYVSEHWEEIGR